MACLNGRPVRTDYGANVLAALQNTVRINMCHRKYTVLECAWRDSWYNTSWMYHVAISELCRVGLRLTKFNLLLGKVVWVTWTVGGVGSRNLDPCPSLRKIRRTNEKSAQRDANTARAGRSKVRTPPARLPAITNPQTGPITIHCAAAS